MSEGPRTDLATEIIAKKIIELAREGERDTVPLQPERVFDRRLSATHF
jgi:hypothetical protein